MHPQGGQPLYQKRSCGGLSGTFGAECCFECMQSGQLFSTTERPGESVVLVWSYGIVPVALYIYLAYRFFQRLAAW